HDTADVDRFDADDPEKRRQDNALPQLGDVAALAAALGVTIPRLRWLAYHREVDSGTHYHRWSVPKRDGSPRLISAPKPELKAVQRWIMREVTEHLPLHGAAHGFVVGRSIVTNARVHAGARVVVKLDIRGFYPTVTMRRVKGLLRRAGLGEQVATVMALLATESPREAVVTHGKTYHVATGPRSLPQGAPTSPSITNALCLRLDCRLSGLARVLGCRYTRYADDLTFSWHGGAASQVGALLRGVGAIVRAEGFELHAKKTRVMRVGARQKVTGLVVNQAPDDRPVARVPRTTQRALRAAIRNRELGRPGKGETLEQLKGMAAFVMMTDPVRGRAFMERVDRLIAARAAPGGSGGATGGGATDGGGDTGDGSGGGSPR
ncbi:MAG TPA: reverse transcriptase family protein, partial [Kofleriaceae bacterium]|nr:reverse transcriptase family protein [Kofleriaceae bacterium]